MDRAILPLLGAIFLLILGAGVSSVYYTHPAMGWHTKVLFWTVGVGLPDSLKTQRDKALAANVSSARDLAQCQANSSTLQSAVAAQNTAVDGLRRESEARVADSQKAALAASAVATRYRSQAQAILDARAASPDSCVAADLLILKEAGH